MSISEELVKLAEDLQDLTEGSVAPWDTDENEYNSVANSYADLYNSLDSASLLKIASDLTLLAAAKEEDGEGVKLASESDEIFQYTPAEALLMEKLAAVEKEASVFSKVKNTVGKGVKKVRLDAGRVIGSAKNTGAATLKLIREHPVATLGSLAGALGAGLTLEEILRRRAHKTDRRR